MRWLHGKRVLLGVTGGIAAYKSAMLARALRRAGADVRALLTEAAARFVTPLTFEALTENACLTDADFFATGGGVTHVEIARQSDLILIAPTTATTLARLANGFADNLLSAVVLASSAPVLVVPSMHTGMWTSLAVRRNVALLDPGRFTVMEPESGDLASGDHGAGRFPEIPDIVDAAGAVLAPRDLAGRVVVVTAGPTREHLDAVRVLTNPSTGLMGVAVARAAQARGARVRLVLGPTGILPPRALGDGTMEVTRVETADEMLAALRARVADADVLVMAAAVADERPAAPVTGKLRKDALPATLVLERTPDILKTLRPALRGKVVVGFAAETDDVEASGRRKLKDKGLSLLFANRVGPGLGFGAPDNQGILLGADGTRSEIGSMPKDDVADLLLDAVVVLLPKGDAS